MLLRNFSCFCRTFGLIPTPHDCTQHQEANQQSNNYSLAKFLWIRHNDSKRLSSYSILLMQNVAVRPRSRILSMSWLGDSLWRFKESNGSFAQWSGVLLWRRQLCYCFGSLNFGAVSGIIWLSIFLSFLPCLFSWFITNSFYCDIHDLYMFCLSRN